MSKNISRTNGVYDYRIAYTKQEGLDYGYYDPCCVIAQDTLDIIHLEFPQTKDEWTFDAVFSKLEDKYKCIIDIETPEGMIPMLCITQEGNEIVHRDICKVPGDYTSMSYLPSEDIWFNVVAGTSYYTNGQSTVKPFRSSIKGEEQTRKDSPMSQEHTKTPYERGRIAGQWTKEQIASCGFKSAQECLEHQEQVYQDETAALPDLYKINPEYAAKQAEYLEGLIAGTRESLKK